MRDDDHHFFSRIELLLSVIQSGKSAGTIVLPPSKEACAKRDTYAGQNDQRGSEQETGMLSEVNDEQNCQYSKIGPEALTTKIFTHPESVEIPQKHDGGGQYQAAQYAEQNPMYMWLIFHRKTPSQQL